MFVTIGLILGLLFAMPAAGDAQEVEAREVEKLLISPCCWSQPVSEHPSSAAEKIKKEIPKLIKEGKTQEEILDYYVAAYGERILAKPRAQGFNLLAYTMPVFFLILGGTVIFIFLRNAQIKEPTREDEVVNESQAEHPEVDETYESRVEGELRRLM